MPWGNEEIGMTRASRAFTAANLIILTLAEKNKLEKFYDYESFIFISSSLSHLQVCSRYGLRDFVVQICSIT